MLTWAREYRGLSIEDAAERLLIEVETLAALEAGVTKLNLTQFRRYSEKLRIPLATLLRQTPPPLPPTPLDFRTFSGARPSLGFDVRLAISYAYTVEQNILELVDAHAAPRRGELPVVGLGADPDRAGERERQRLGVSAEAQLSWQWGDAFRNWRTILEGAGVYVLQQKFDLEDCRGFTVFRNPDAPIIMLNKAEQYDSAKIYSLLHEYAHLLLRQPGLSDLGEKHPVEAFCNRFAAGFLMPRSLLKEVLPYWPDSPVDWDRDLIAHYARRIKVSQQALALRLEQLGLAPAGFFARLVGQQKVSDSRSSPGGNYVSTQVSEVGYRFTTAVLNAADADRITTAEAAEMLSLAPKHFGMLKDRLDRQLADVGFGAVHY
ncbi:Zn-dependent peptidase ImmA, M78 family [Sphingomonas laterariae]|uniref:Zn-dependent peptidase ImmA, M78 family n=2 Tax=Edaphosphingomonas laterariae TaxID=861865 RepID=A0A239CWF4_9SPHN|nr:Zn-dependent peptidase ImmA, M78 family [Sphingomonas laterariae]